MKKFWLANSLLLLGGCARDLHSGESMLDPAGPQAARIGSLTWLTIGICLVVYVLVLFVLLAALLHRRHGHAMAPVNDPLEPSPAGERRLWKTVSASIAVSVVTLFLILFADFATGRAAYQFSKHQSETIHIHLIGHQWWWEAVYVDWPERFGYRSPSNQITTANEFHIPVDPAHPVAVEFQLDSHDVIHSFWVPNLQGKRDLIPGHPTSLWLSADRPGNYWGECAEYCGYQHAQMRCLIVAEPPEQFQACLSAQRQEANEPTEGAAIRGKKVLLNTSCIMCHSIAGTEARGRVGPDLTHVASRQVLAGGAIQNTRGDLAGWISNAQSIKPGCRMTPHNLSPDDLRDLLEYVETLK